MATISKGYTFGSTELVTNTKLHGLVDDATVTEIVNADVNATAAITYTKLSLTGGIVNADINASAAIGDSKLAQIATASKVSGAALTSLGSVPTGAGALPTKNGGTAADFSATAQGSIPYFSAAGVISALSPSTSGYFLKTQGASADPTWAQVTTEEVFTSSGTFTAPAGVTKVYVTMCGGGGGGGSGISGAGGGGGGSAEAIMGLPYTVVPASTYTVTIGAGGATDADGGDTSFGTGTVYTVSKGLKGVAAGSGAQGGAGASANSIAGSNATDSAIGAGGTFYSWAGGTGGNGNNAGPGKYYGGGGAGSMFGVGGNGGNASVGSAGTGYGSGGGGGGGVNSGGAGAAGFVRLQW